MLTLFSTKNNIYLTGVNSLPQNKSMKILRMFSNKKYKEKNNSKEKSHILFLTLIILMLMNIKEMLLVK